MQDYINGGSCGNLMREKWVNDKLIELDSKAVRLGAYFEYILTGALPKDGKTPQPDFYKKYSDYVHDATLMNVKYAQEKKPIQKIKAPTPADMLAPYQLAHLNKNRVLTYFDLMGIKIIKFGRRLTKGKHEGTIDLLCEATKKIIFKDGTVWNIGDQFVIDIKYAATIDDRWSKHGWVWTPEQLEYHGNQAKQYHFITGLPFYFLVVSSTNEFDIKLFRMVISEEKIMAHLALANDLEEKLKFYNEMGWEARPDIAKCGECPLRLTCPDKATYPQVETIEL